MDGAHGLCWCERTTGVSPTPLSKLGGDPGSTSLEMTDLGRVREGGEPAVEAPKHAMRPHAWGTRAFVAELGFLLEVELG